MSIPYSGRQFTFTQPDGTKLEVLGYGDQYKAVFETLDGYTVCQDASGFYRYAQVVDGELRATHLTPGAGSPVELGISKGLRGSVASRRGIGDRSGGLLVRARRCEERWRIRREARQNAPTNALRAPPSRPTIGEYRGLCILVQFPNVKGTIPTEEVTKFCNEPGYQGFGNNGSVYDYYVDNSHAKLKYTNVVTQYYTAKHELAYYADTKLPFGKRAAELIGEALASLKASGFDFSTLSVDSSGFVYAVNVFYAGACPNDWGKGLWPHSYALPAALTLAPGRKAYDYQITNIGNELSLATFCHENGHMVCDYPDFYDYGYESYGAGSYCLMAFGGQNPKNPLNICAYLRYKSGWYDSVKAIANGMEYVLERESKDLLWLPKNTTEYFLFENRVQKGRDAALPAAGLAIWHIDERGSNDSEQMTLKSHYECALEQADGRFDLEKKANYGNPGDLFTQTALGAFSDRTTPNANWWDGSLSGLDIHDISPAGDTMRFRVGASAPTTGNTNTLTKTIAPKVAIPDNNKTGITSEIDWSDAGDVTLAGVEVDVQIRHTYRGDLRVSLTSPSGTTVVLSDRSGGGDDDLRKRFDATSAPDLVRLLGEPLSGKWKLLVQDLAKSDIGVLEAWSLFVTTQAAPEVALSEEPGVLIPDNDQNGITRSLDCAESGTVEFVEVEVDITHSYVGDLVIKLVAPSGTEILLAEQQGGDTDNLVTTFTPDVVPQLATLIGQPIQGVWRLMVSDRAGSDIGKLARWKVRMLRKS